MSARPLRLPLNAITLRHIAIGCRTPYSLHRFLQSEIGRILESWRWGLIERDEGLIALDHVWDLLPCAR